MLVSSSWPLQRSRALIAAAGSIAMMAAPVASAQHSAVAKVYKTGPRLQFDFPQMRVGIAEYDEGPTGTTVFYFPGGVKGAVDVRGGSPGTVNATDERVRIPDDAGRRLFWRFVVRVVSGYGSRERHEGAEGDRRKRRFHRRRRCGHHL